ncbi:sensor histidine kinase [Flavobacterium orientale]|uniref:histidine kinase n=1 Tax=Flavobacterium orientale TaxID=1756020 RepID=A0A916YAB9_9FLAO|nr:HAMP domain-containing sensor histidine kinase [Flavobacterium orientale]GGD36728.1 hypothetical protein GCM10011343_28120 [Flavobacterium orientale]
MVPKKLLNSKNYWTDYYFLIVTVLVSSGLLIVVNFYTIRILSGSRAYINGESHYSKAQKDASRHLVAYLYNADSSAFQAFTKEITVPLGDQIARLEMNKEGNIATIKAGFVQGRNHEDDLNDMIWLYQNFKSFPFFSKAVAEWEVGDQKINALVAVASEIEAKINANTLTPQDQQLFVNQLNTIIDELTIKQSNFSKALGQGTRKVKSLLVVTNIFFIILIITFVSSYYFKMMRRLKANKIKLESANKQLKTANKELDRFVYSASHDLRSPITSLMGLVVIIKHEEDAEKRKEYVDMMSQILQSQDQFIKDIIDYSRNNKIKITIEKINLSYLINETVFQYQFTNHNLSMQVIQELETDYIYTDVLRLKIILNNLISNAFKYADLTKSENYIKVKSTLKGTTVTLEIEDNGMGINPQYLDKIFDMFFVTDSNKGSGLGLYIAKEAVENLNGTITAQSEPKAFTKFSITLPNQPDTKN